MTAQPMSAHALLRGVSREGLTNGVRYASVAGMKTQLNSDGAAAGVVQPAPSAALLNEVADERLASGVRCAKVAGMNRRAGTQITRGGGAYCLAWQFRGSVCSASQLEGFWQCAEGAKNEGARKFFEGFCGFTGKSVSFRLGGRGCGVRLGVVGFCGCLTDRPCRGVGLFRPESVFVFHFASLLKPDLGGSVN